MQNSIKAMSMLIVIAAAIVSSLVILEVITIDLAKDTIFKSVFVILILTISSLIITSILDKPKKIR
jgi:hypothetical protein